jgi:hypothetical protein
MTAGGSGPYRAPAPTPVPPEPMPAPPEPTTPDSPDLPSEPLPTYEDPPPVNPVAQRTARPSLRGRAVCGSWRVSGTRDVV